jgi:hypothetical protein
MEPATSRLVAQCLNQLRYRVSWGLYPSSLRSDRQFLVYLTLHLFIVNIVSWNWIMVFPIFQFMRAINACDGAYIYVTNFYELIDLLLVAFPHFPRFSLCHSLYFSEVFLIFTQTHNSLHNQASGRDVLMTTVNLLSFYFSFVSFFLIHWIFGCFT